MRDALFLTVRLLNIMDRRRCTLHQLAAELPRIGVFRSEVSGGISPSGLYELFGSAAEAPAGTAADFTAAASMEAVRSAAAAVFPAVAAASPVAAVRLAAGEVPADFKN